MARTKASVGAKVASGKSSKARCCVAPAPSSSGSSGSGDRSSRSHSGGNPVCPRETPKWQKPITNFFINKDPPDQNSESEVENAEAGTSKSKPKRNIIESDDEVDPETPKNQELDETINLEPLNGDNSHKLEEYYTTEKGKGKGKKTKDKENVDNNNMSTERRNSKRDLEDSEEVGASKRIKIN